MAGGICNCSFGIYLDTGQTCISQYAPELIQFSSLVLPLSIIAFLEIALSDLKKEFINAGKCDFIAFLNAVGYYIQLKALSLGDALQVIPIVSSESVLTILGGVFILNEKSHLLHKLLAGVIMLFKDRPQN